MGWIILDDDVDERKAYSTLFLNAIIIFFLQHPDRERCTRSQGSQKNVYWGLYFPEKSFMPCNDDVRE